MTSSYFFTLSTWLLVTKFFTLSTWLLLTKFFTLSTWLLVTKFFTLSAWLLLTKLFKLSFNFFISCVEFNSNVLLHIFSWLLKWVQILVWEKQSDCTWRNVFFGGRSMYIYVQGRWQPTQSQLIQICSVDRRLRLTQHWTQNRTSKPLKYQRTTNTTATLVVKYQ